MSRIGTNHTYMYGHSILASISCPVWCHKNKNIAGLVYNNIVRENTILSLFCLMLQKCEATKQESIFV